MTTDARCLLLLSTLLLAACGGSPQPSETFDAIVRGGTVNDGGGGAPVHADVGIRGDTIAAIGDLSGAATASAIDVTRLAVAPGFINRVEVLADGEHTGATPGRVVRGPGRTG